MGKMGFHPQWLDRVMKCVETVSYRIKNERWSIGHDLVGKRNYTGRFHITVCQQWLSFKLSTLQNEGRLMGIMIKQGRRE